MTGRQDKSSTRPHKLRMRNCWRCVAGNFNCKQSFEIGLFCSAHEMLAQCSALPPFINNNLQITNRDDSSGSDKQIPDSFISSAVPDQHGQRSMCMQTCSLNATSSSSVLVRGDRLALPNPFEVGPPISRSFVKSLPCVPYVSKRPSTHSTFVKKSMMSAEPTPICQPHPIIRIGLDTDDAVH